MEVNIIIYQKETHTSYASYPACEYFYYAQNHFIIFGIMLEASAFTELDAKQ